MIATEYDRVRSFDELGLDRQNQAALGRLLATGTAKQAVEGSDGRMQARVRVVPDQLIWDPAVLVLPHGGTVDIEIVNDDVNTHTALFPSNGDSQFIQLPVYSRGRAVVALDGPGCYWFSSPIGNDEGSGLVGAIVVRGEVPSQARLDRPEQTRP